MVKIPTSNLSLQEGMFNAAPLYLRMRCGESAEPDEVLIVDDESEMGIIGARLFRNPYLMLLS